MGGLSFEALGGFTGPNLALLLRRSRPTAEPTGRCFSAAAAALPRGVCCGQDWWKASASGGHAWQPGMGAWRGTMDGHGNMDGHGLGIWKRRDGLILFRRWHSSKVRVNFMITDETCSFGQLDKVYDNLARFNQSDRDLENNAGNINSFFMMIRTSFSALWRNTTHQTSEINLTGCNKDCLHGINFEFYDFTCWVHFLEFGLDHSRIWFVLCWCSPR